ncbi:MAG: lytic transglycosylase domain-containing protein [bacterium]
MTLFLTLLVAMNLCYSSTSKYINDNIITESFNIPKGLENAVDFWIDVYSKYDTNQIIVHDTENYIIYDVIDVSDVSNLPYFTQQIKDEIVNSRVLRVQKKYRDTLKALQNNKNDLQEMDQFTLGVHNKYIGINDENKFIDASRPGRMRIQRGQRSEFKKGLSYSEKYIPTMEKIFKHYRLPTELSRLPFVESYFNPHALSYKKASGIWQFMKGTGSEYLKVKGKQDQRNDPIASTHAAAKLLKQSYTYLYKNWPLAITAYNHGRFGMKRAAQNFGTTDLVKLIKTYKGETFGFASKNFYAEFLAALYLEKNHEKFFEDAPITETASYGEIVTVKPIKISQLELLLDVDKEDIRMYNPNIKMNRSKEDAELPEGATIRVPITRFKKLMSETKTVEGLEDYLRFI